MTKEQFYRNYLTEEGQKRNEEEFTNLKTLKRYYKREDIDLNDIAKWDEIIYIPDYGKVDIESGEIKEQQYWQIYSFLDIIKISKRMRENRQKVLDNFDKNKDLDLTEYSKQVFNNLNGYWLFEPIEINNETKDQKILDERETKHIIEETIKQKLNTLPKLEQDIIKMRFGISDIGLNPAPRDAEEIAEHFNITVEEVHNITDKILGYLRE